MNYLYSGESLINSRKSNMDSLLLIRHNIDNQNVLAAVVCDGVSSVTHGEFAALMAARLFREWFLGLENTQNLGQRMCDTVMHMNAQIVATAREQGISTASTFSALLLTAGLYYIVHIGDCRIYKVRNGKLSLLTTDDVSDSGKLTGYIGRKEKISIRYYDDDAKNSTFLICSDGLYRKLNTDVILGGMTGVTGRNLKKKIRRLVKHTLEQGERDNITLALIKS